MEDLISWEKSQNQVVTCLRDVLIRDLSHVMEDLISWEKSQNQVVTCLRDVSIRDLSHIMEDLISYGRSHRIKSSPVSETY